MRLRPSAEPRVPGIYEATESVAIPDIARADTRIAGFVGLAERGPVGVPVRIPTWDEYLETYGSDTQHYLSASVQSYFQNGGPACWVVRVAHLPARGVARSLDHASCAESLQLDDWGKPSLLIQATSEGVWGNQIWYRVAHTRGAEALLTRDVDVGAGEAHVSSVRGFEVGQLVRIFDREHEDFVVLTGIGDKLVRWDTATPVNRRHYAAAPTTLQVHGFELHVSLRERREVFRDLQLDARSRNFAPAVVAARSRLVRLTLQASTTPVPHSLPRVRELTRLEAGRDGSLAITPEDFIGENLGPGQRSGLEALLVTEEVTQIAVPDAMLFSVREPGPAGDQKAQRIQDHLIAACENAADKFAVLDIPLSRDIEYVRRWRRRTDSSYAAYYWPWLVWDGAASGQRVVPASGPMAGLYAQRDAVGVHVTPANVQLAGVSDLALRLTEDHLALLSADGVNGFRVQRGVRPWGGRTASNDPDWRYVSIRRLFIMLRRSLEAGYAWAAFEPNTEKTWEFVQQRTNAFLRQLHAQGMFAPGEAEAVFFVKCDNETNPPDSVEAGRLVCEIGVAPVTPTEFITLSLTQEMDSPT